MEEEVALALRVQKGDVEARARLLEGSLWLVVKVAREFEGRGLDLPDLVGEGNVGLIEATKRFDPALGRSFSSYAAFLIRVKIRRALANHSRPVRLPVSANVRLRQIHHATDRLVASLERDPTDAEISSRTGLSEKEIRRLRTAALRPLSLDQSWGAEEVCSPLDFIPDERTRTPWEILAHREELELVGKALRKLSRVERTVLWQRIGMDGNGERTLAEVGQQLGFTREWTRQIQNRALQRLRGMLTGRNGHRRGV